MADRMLVYWRMQTDIRAYQVHLPGQPGFLTFRDPLSVEAAALTRPLAGGQIFRISPPEEAADEAANIPVYVGSINAREVHWQSDTPEAARVATAEALAAFEKFKVEVRDFAFWLEDAGAVSQNDEDLLPNGEPAWSNGCRARVLAARFGGQVASYQSADNPHAAMQWHDGRPTTFALLGPEGRLIADTRRVVWDRLDPLDARDIEVWFGPAENWHFQAPEVTPVSVYHARHFSGSPIASFDVNVFEKVAEVAGGDLRLAYRLTTPGKAEGEPFEWARGNHPALHVMPGVSETARPTYTGDVFESGGILHSYVHGQFIPVPVQWVAELAAQQAEEQERHANRFVSTPGSPADSRLRP